MNEQTIYQERVIHINRVAKVVKGGRNFAFTALVAVGDGEGNVGIGYGKGKEVPLAIQKAIENAKKEIHTIPMAGSTIVHTITGHHGASEVLTVATERAANTLVYTDGTQGWLLKNK